VVHSNDPQNPRITLTIQGYIEKFVDIEPKSVRLTGYVGEHIAVPVTIVPEVKHSFKILNAAARKGTDITYALKQRDPSQGRGYTLLIENKKMEKGRYHDVITLKTDSDIKRILRVRVFGNILEKQTKKTGS
jgi:hypothetical protein